MVYPQAVSQLQGANFWAVIFFLMLVTLGLDTMVRDFFNFVLSCVVLFVVHRQEKALLQTYQVLLKT